MTFDLTFLSAKVGSVIRQRQSPLSSGEEEVTCSKYGKSRYVRANVSWAPFRIKRSRGALINDRREEGTQVREGRYIEDAARGGGEAKSREIAHSCSIGAHPTRSVKRSPVRLAQLFHSQRRRRETVLRGRGR